MPGDGFSIPGPSLVKMIHWTETQSLERRLGKAFEISLSMGNTFSSASWVSEQLSLQKSLKTESFKAPWSAPPSACFSACFPQTPSHWEWQGCL